MSGSRAAAASKKCEARTLKTRKTSPTAFFARSRTGETRWSLALMSTHWICSARAFGSPRLPSLHPLLAKDPGPVEGLHSGPGPRRGNNAISTCRCEGVTILPCSFLGNLDTTSPSILGPEDFLPLPITRYLYTYPSLPIVRSVLTVLAFFGLFHYISPSPHSTSCTVRVARRTLLTSCALFVFSQTVFPRRQISYNMRRWPVC